MTGATLAMSGGIGMNPAITSGIIVTITGTRGTTMSILA
jgi:hypothetical protein